jgi:hypothetical protein
MSTSGTSTAERKLIIDRVEIRSAPEVLMYAKEPQHPNSSPVPLLPQLENFASAVFAAKIPTE